MLFLCSSSTGRVGALLVAGLLSFPIAAHAEETPLECAGRFVMETGGEPQTLNFSAIVNAAKGTLITDSSIVGSFDDVFVSDTSVRGYTTLPGGLVEIELSRISGAFSGNLYKKAPKDADMWVEFDQERYSYVMFFSGDCVPTRKIF